MENSDTNSETAEKVPEVCGYCGRENADKLHICAGCGTTLVEEPAGDPAPAEQRAKSPAVAIILAIIFGPIGLLYVRAWEAAAIMIAIGAVLFLTHNGGIWLMVVSRIIAVAWAYYLVTLRDKISNAPQDYMDLLDTAARLESSDRFKAIATYEEIIRLYPGTPAGKEAAQNIRVLKQQP